MDTIDVRILRALQRDSSRPVAELAAEVGLSPSACHRRVKLLEQAGVVRGYAARLDPRAIGLRLEAFVTVTLETPGEPAMAALEAAMSGIPELLECHLLSGQGSYLLRLALHDVEDFERLLRGVLGRLPGVGRIETEFVLRTVHPWHGYPVPEQG